MAASWRLLPCSSCCNCVIFSDQFERASIGNDWQVKTGTWSIVNVSGDRKLQGCGTGTRILWTGEEELTDNFSVLVKVNFTAAGQKARIFFGGDQTDAYYAEFEVGPIVNSSYPLYSRMFTPDGTQIGSTQTYTTNWTSTYVPIKLFFCVWSDGDNYRVLTSKLYATDSGTPLASYRFDKVDVASFPGGRVGLGGDDADACLLFDDFQIARPEDICIPCYIECPDIRWDEKPSCLKLTFTGFGNGPCLLWGSWEGCHCLNRTIYLVGGNCLWRNNIKPADFCFDAYTLYTGGAVYWQIDIRYDAGHYWLYVTLYAGYRGAWTSYWRADLGTEKPEAKTLDVSDFVLVEDKVSDICDISNVALHVEAVDGDPCPPQQNRCLVCGPQCGEYPLEIRLRTSGFGGDNDGDFILSPDTGGVVDWYHYECKWLYDGAVKWYVTFQYNKQGPSQYNVFVHHGTYWDGVWGSQVWPIDCSDFTITLTSGEKTAIISNV